MDMNPIRHGQFRKQADGMRINTGTHRVQVFAADSRMQMPNRPNSPPSADISNQENFFIQTRDIDRGANHAYEGLSLFN
jgi:hypothetical protein